MVQVWVGSLRSAGLSAQRGRAGSEGARQLVGARDLPWSRRDGALPPR